jgi:hypothetical protein
MDISGNLAGDLIMDAIDSENLDANLREFQEDLEPPREYEVEDLLEMLGGDQYYSMDKVMFVYHTLRCEDDEASYYKDIMDKKDIALNKKLSKMKNKNIG